MAMELGQVKTRLGAGLLAFPVTHFTADLGFDEPSYRINLQANLAEDPSALFCPGGTGEFFSLTLAECRRRRRRAGAAAISAEMRPGRVARPSRGDLPRRQDRRRGL